MNPTFELFAAIKAGNAVKVKELIAAHPALVNAQDETGVPAILMAKYCGQSAIVDFLLASGAELNIFAAAATNQLDRVAALCEADTSLVNAYSSDGFPVLGLAAFFGHLEVVEFLLAQGADPNAAARNPMRVTSLHAAVAHHQADAALAIAERLLTHGANANAAQQSGWMPLHEASARGQDRLVTLLLSHGAEINARNDDGKTPLSLAIEKGHSATAELLRRSGATETAELIHHS